MLISYSINCSFFATIFLIHYFLFPNTIYPYAILPKILQENLLTSILLYLIIGVFQIRMLAIVLFVLLSFFALVGSYFMVILRIILKEFKSNRNDYTTIDVLREPDNLVKMYRTFELHHKMAVRVFGMIILPVHTAIMQGIRLVNFILISYYDQLNTITKLMLIGFTIIAQICWFGPLSCSGLFHQHAVATLKSWKYFKFSNKHDAKYIAKFRKSCKPLVLGTDGYFYIKRITVLKFVRGIITGTFRALLTVRNI